MIAFLLIAILVVLGFMAASLNPRFTQFLKSLFKLSLGLGALVIFLIIVGLVIWGGYYLITNHSDTFLGALYFLILLLLIYVVVIWPLQYGQNFLKRKGVIKNDHPKIFKTLIFIVGVFFVVLLSLLLSYLGL